MSHDTRPEDHDSTFNLSAEDILPEGDFGRSHLDRGTARSADARRGKPKQPGHVAMSTKDYSAAEMEVLAEMEKFKQATGRRFPATTDVMHVMINKLGYRKPEPEAVAHKARLSG